MSQPAANRVTRMVPILLCLVYVLAQCNSGTLLVAAPLFVDSLEVVVREADTQQSIAGATVGLYCDGMLEGSFLTDSTGSVTLMLAVDDVQDEPFHQPSPLAVFPNPVVHKADLLVDTESTGILVVALYDMLGREEVHQSLFAHPGRYHATLSLSGLPAGSYFATVTDVTGNRRSARLVKQTTGTGTPAIHVHRTGREFSTLAFSAQTQPLKHDNITSDCEIRVSAEGFNPRTVALLASDVSLLVELDRETYTNSFGIEFVRLPAGTFEMGSDRGQSDERPVRSVTLTQDCWLSRYEVTQAQWMAVMGYNPSFYAACGADCPVERVSWYDVDEFIQRLNMLEGTTAYRLPTEAEWECAVRAGTTTAYSFGDDVDLLDEHSWYQDNSNLLTHPVGQKMPNPWGLYDMHGNVWEWLEDWYDYYPSAAPVEDPTGPESGRQRVQRGGSSRETADFLRSSFRGFFFPGGRDVDVGFRLLKELE